MGLPVRLPSGRTDSPHPHLLSRPRSRILSRARPIEQGSKRSIGDAAQVITVAPTSWAAWRSTTGGGGRLRPYAEAAAHHAGANASPLRTKPRRSRGRLGMANCPDDENEQERRDNQDEARLNAPSRKMRWAPLALFHALQPRPATGVSRFQGGESHRSFGSPPCLAACASTKTWRSPAALDLSPDRRRGAIRKPRRVPRRP